MQHFLEQTHQPTVGFSVRQQFKAAEDVSEASVSTKLTITRTWKKADAQSKPLIGNVTQGEDFPKQNAVRPDVTLERVHAVENALWRHPLDWQTSLQ